MPHSTADFSRRFWALIAPAIVAATFGSTLAAADEASIEALRQRGQQHWAFQPLERLPVDSHDVTAEIDRIVALRREETRLESLGRADRRTLVRRLFFHLTGLPPTQKEMETAVSDDSPNAIAALVDDLLARPEFGERWGRHWLDVARYADSNGCGLEANNTYDNAWRYRDYVIASFNDDKTFDRFIIEQVAGDLLESTAEYRRAERLIATGFLMLGPKAFGTRSMEQLRLDAIDDQIDSVGKAFLGLSLGCARCHDHKLEPVSTEEYYALAGIFGSTTTVIDQAGWPNGRTWTRRPLPGLDLKSADALRELHQRKLADAKAGDLADRAKAALEKLEKELAELQHREDAEEAGIENLRERIEATRLKLRNADQLAKVLPRVSPIPVAMAPVEAEAPSDEAIRPGGRLDAKGEVVTRNVPLLPNARSRDQYQIPDNASGRLQLARWLVDVDDGAGPLTARVIVNRVWHHLLGQGIVPSVDNFGLTGEPPTHPQLLEVLAASIVDDGWSIKQLIRSIVLTETYQLASGDCRSAATIDPGNRWLWRRTPRRLEAEALRDAVLAISGRLDRTRGGKTLQHLGLVTFDSNMIHLATPSPYLRRTVYLPIIRDAIGVSPEIDATCIMLDAFDGASPNLVCGAREMSVTPIQSLFLMNSEFIADNAEHAAKKLLANSPALTTEQRVDFLFQAVLGRPAADAEVSDAVQLLDALPEQDESLDSESREMSEPSDEADENRQVAAWAGLCQAVFSCNEFLFLR